MYTHLCFVHLQQKESEISFHPILYRHHPTSLTLPLYSTFRLFLCQSHPHSLWVPHPITFPTQLEVQRQQPLKHTLPPPYSVQKAFFSQTPTASLILSSFIYTRAGECVCTNRVLDFNKTFTIILCFRVAAAARIFRNTKAPSYTFSSTSRVSLYISSASDILRHCSSNL